MLLQRLNECSIQSCKLNKGNGRFSFNSQFIRHKSLRVKKPVILQDDPVPSWYKGPRIGEFEAETVIQLNSNPSSLNIKRLGQLPRGKSQVNNAFVVNGVPFIVHYADLFKLDTKTWEFEKVPYTGNLIASEQAVYDKKTNKVIFSRDIHMKDITNISNMLTLDMSNMHVSEISYPEEFLRTKISLTEKGKLVCFGQEPKNIARELFVTFRKWLEKENKWEQFFVDGERNSPPAARFSWLNQSVGDDVYIFAHSGRRKEEASVWRYNSETTKMEGLNPNGVAPVYHEKATSFQLTVEGKKKVGIYGGQRERGGQVTSNIALLDIESSSWDPSPNVAGEELKGRYNHRMISLNDKEALVFGGIDQEGNHLDEFFMITSK